MAERFVTRNHPHGGTRNEDSDSKHFLAGRLQYFVKRWKAWRAPDTLIQIIQSYRIPFVAKPPLVIPNLMNHPLQTFKSSEMDKVIVEMLKMRVIEPVSVSPSFVSPIFLISKSDGTSRPIFNLKSLNRYVLVQKFRLINVNKISTFLQPRDWLVKIDLSKAYFHQPIAVSHRRFLRLIYDRQLYQMTCLPFGLACAPKVFASLTNWVAQVLRDRGIRVAVYLDDFLLANQDPVILTSQALEVTRFLEHLGWQINYAKSTLIPQTSLQYLGITWNTHLNKKYLPRQKCRNIRTRINSVLKARKARLREVQCLVGSVNFASFTVPRGRLNHRALLMHCQHLLHLNPAHSFPLPSPVQKELKWWLSNLEKSTPIHYPPVTNYLVTDASGIAWGAQLDHVKLAGRWSPEEARLHSNHREMLAIWHVLKDHAPRLATSSLLIQSDNRTVVAYLRNEGGTKSMALMDLTYKILKIIDLFNIHIVIHYLPGRYNSEADHLSRLSRPPEWHLLPTITNQIFAKFGRPVIDLFASAVAHVVPKYVTLDLTDMQAYRYDAFSHVWDYPLAWVFPPPFLIPRVLQHLNSARGTFLVVAPRWLKVFWRPDLKNRAIGPPFTIYNLNQVFIDATTGNPPPLAPEMTLEVWRCGGGQRC